MADRDDIINTPITSDEFKSSDFPDKEKEENSVDPEDMDLEDDLNIGDDEIDPVDDGLGLGDEEFSNELKDDSLFDEPKEPEMIAPEEQIKWTTVPQENGDIWSEHENGFVLRARPLSAKKGPQIKYAVQLFKNNKMVEKGVRWVDKNTDQREFLQNIADRVLDRLGLVNYSDQSATAAPPDLGPSEMDSGVEDAVDNETGAEGLDFDF